jgi:hypothetical protein
LFWCFPEPGSFSLAIVKASCRTQRILLTCHILGPIST